MVGQTVGSYCILSKLGQGGMGTVYVAEHPLLRRKAAVKVLLPELSTNAEFVTRFFNEARATTLIKHPGLVDVFDYGQLPNGNAFLIMELLEGESLAARIKRLGGLGLGLSVEIARQIASALAATHAKGIVHRDLKPDNVFLVPDLERPSGWRVKLLDFGIAKLTSDDEPELKTRTGILMGTPQYMSPEQCRGAGDIDHRTDIYALACMLYEMLTGQRPFHGEGPGDIIAAHLHLPPPRLDGVSPATPVDLEELVRRSMAKKPDERPQSATEVGRLLEGIQAQLPPDALSVAHADTLGEILSRPPGAVVSSTTLGHSAAELSTPPQRPSGKKKDPQKGRARIAGWAVVVAAVGAAALLLVLRPQWTGGHPPTPTPPAAVVQPQPLPVSPQPQPQPVLTQPAPLITLRIESQPSGAEVFRAFDGVRVGRTPLVREVPPTDGESIYVVRLTGYRDEPVSLANDRNGMVRLTLQHQRSTTTAPRPERTEPHRAEKPPVVAPSTDTPKPIRNDVLDPFQPR